MLILLGVASKQAVEKFSFISFVYSADPPASQDKSKGRIRRTLFMWKRFHAIAHWNAEPIKAGVCAVSTPSDRKVCRDLGQPCLTSAPLLRLRLLRCRSRSYNCVPACLWCVIARCLDSSGFITAMSSRAKCAVFHGLLRASPYGGSRRNQAKLGIMRRPNVRLKILLDPCTDLAKDTTVIRALQSIDIALLHPA